MRHREREREREIERERGRDTDRGRSRLPAGSPMWDSIPGPRDHALSQRQMLHHWATQAPQINKILKKKICQEKTEEMSLPK